MDYKITCDEELEYFRKKILEKDIEEEEKKEKKRKLKNKGRQIFCHKNKREFWK